jgi:hypothetical protein
LPIVLQQKWSMYLLTWTRELSTYLRSFFHSSACTLCSLSLLFYYIRPSSILNSPRFHAYCYQVYPTGCSVGQANLDEPYGLDRMFWKGKGAFILGCTSPFKVIMIDRPGMGKIKNWRKGCATWTRELSTYLRSFFHSSACTLCSLSLLFYYIRPSSILNSPRFHAYCYLPSFCLNQVYPTGCSVGQANLDEPYGLDRMFWKGKGAFILGCTSPFKVIMNFRFPRTTCGPVYKQIKVITKLPNSEQTYKGKVKTHNYINRQNQSNNWREQ